MALTASTMTNSSAFKIDTLRKSLCEFFAKHKTEFTFFLFQNLSVAPYCKQGKSQFPYRLSLVSIPAWPLYHPAHWVAQKLHVCVISKWFCSASPSPFPSLCRSKPRSHILQETLLISWATLCSLSDHWYPVDVNIFSHCFTTFPFWFFSSWRIVSRFILLYVCPLASKRQRQKRCLINVHQMELTCIQSLAQTHQSFSSKPLPSSR